MKKAKKSVAGKRKTKNRGMLIVGAFAILTGIMYLFPSIDISGVYPIIALACGGLLLLVYCRD